jgi:hypothetical protein
MRVRNTLSCSHCHYYITDITICCLCKYSVEQLTNVRIGCTHSRDYGETNIPPKFEGRTSYFEREHEQVGNAILYHYSSISNRGDVRQINRLLCIWKSQDALG